jgi:asparagine synthetase B (glutamine-hydrolysing)
MPFIQPSSHPAIHLTNNCTLLSNTTITLWHQQAMLVLSQAKAEHWHTQNRKCQRHDIVSIVRSSFDTSLLHQRRKVHKVCIALSRGVGSSAVSRCQHSHHTCTRKLLLEHRHGRKGAALWRKTRARLTVRLTRCLFVPKHDCIVFLTWVKCLKVNRKRESM